MSTPTNRISIIMPVKDTAPYLPDCLESIQQQTYVHWELIAVNDGSSDRSLEILEEFARSDTRITVLDNPEPALLNALRLGYQHATGVLIHRMDSDDKMPNYKLEVMEKAWREYGKGSVITGGTKYFVDHGEVGDGFRRYDAWLCEVARNNSYGENIYRECVIPSNCWLIHREDFDRVQGFEPSTLPEDYDLCFRLYAVGLSIVGLDTVLHYWRDRPDRISRTEEAYRDNRFFELKVKYFFELDRDHTRPLVLWGAGKNGKDLAKLFIELEQPFHWVCDNANKVGKDIYGVKMQHFEAVEELNDPQLVVAVASPEGQVEIESLLKNHGRRAGQDYWFFA